MIRTHKIIAIACSFIVIAGISFQLLWKEKQTKFSKTTEEKPFVIVIPSYNNSEWYKKNLGSVFAQKYSNYRIIYIDDCSSDKTDELVKKYIEEQGYTDRVTLIHNKVNRGAMANHFKAGHMCNDHEIIIDLDGDDWFKDEYVLQRLNQVYTDPSVWMTYGQFEIYPSCRKGFCKEIPAVIHEKGLYREYEWVSSHLRSFYAWLFKHIKLEDCLHRGKWLPVDCDKLIMFSLLEMAREHSRFIPDILYVYNCASPINDYKAHLVLHRYYNQVICAGKKYLRINQAPDTKKNAIDDVPMIIFSKDNPLLLSALLESAQKFLLGCFRIHVLYNASTDKYKQTYNKLEILFKTVDFHSYYPEQKSSLSQTIEPLLNQTEYILFAHDGIIIKETIDLHQCTQALHETHAYGFYLTLGKNITKNHRLNRQQKQPPFIDLDNKMYAWQFSCGEYNWRKPQTLSLALYRANDIKKALENTLYNTPIILEALWQTASFDMNYVGLICEHSAAFILEKSIEPALSFNLFKEGFKLDLAKLSILDNQSAHVKQEPAFLQKEYVFS